MGSRIVVVSMMIMMIMMMIPTPDARNKDLFLYTRIRLSAICVQNKIWPRMDIPVVKLKVNISHKLLSCAYIHITRS